MFYSTSNLWKFEKQNIVVQYVAFDGPLEKNLREMEGWNTHCIVYTHNYSILWAQNWQWWAPDKSGSCATIRMTSGERPKPMSGPTCLSIPIITSRSKENGFGFKRVTPTILVGGLKSFSNLIHPPITTIQIFAHIYLTSILFFLYTCYFVGTQDTSILILWCYCYYYF